MASWAVTLSVIADNCLIASWVIASWQRITLPTYNCEHPSPMVLPVVGSSEE
jgi:hypothetical protein